MNGIEVTEECKIAFFKIQKYQKEIKSGIIISIISLTYHYHQHLQYNFGNVCPDASGIQSASKSTIKTSKFHLISLTIISIILKSICFTISTSFFSKPVH